MHRVCRKEVEELLGKNGFAHRKFIRQIKQFIKILINHIKDAEDFVNDADILTKKKEYIKKAINQLKDKRMKINILIIQVFLLLFIGFNGCATKNNNIGLYQAINL